jgi:asparagine synthase (glutamine-hydrolysing)
VPHFLIVHDRDPSRRRATIDTAIRQLGDVSALPPTVFNRADTTVVAATEPSTPVASHSDAEGDVLLIGDVLVDGRPCAPQPWRRRAATSALDADGFHVAISLGATGEVTVASDILGIFPVLHLSIGETRLVSSSPFLLRAHPQFRPRLNAVALAGVLLADGQVDAATVFDGVRRVPMGSALHLDPDRGITEIESYSPRLTSDLHDCAPIRRLADILDEVVVAACERHVQPGRTTGLLLSGGLDSRLIAGSLRKCGFSFDALTLGLPTDYEYRFAKRVARALGVPHRLVDDTTEPDVFTRTVRWEGLTATPSIDQDSLPQYGQLVSGFLMDAVTGGSHIDWIYDPTSRTTGFDPFLERLNFHGIPPDALRRLLRRDVFGDAVDEAWTLVRRSFDDCGGSDPERAWRYDMTHRQRFWVGPRVFRQAKSSWPCLPHLDRSVISTVAAMPPAVFASRMVEIEQCKAHSPDLAEIPLDRATHHVTALIPRWHEVLSAAAARAVRQVRDRTPWRQPDTRRFTRIFDIESDAWQTARNSLEHVRRSAYDLFEPTELDRMLPPVGTPMPGPSTYPRSNGAKIVLAVFALLDEGFTT